jgi:hypothetical protein
MRYMIIFLSMLSSIPVFAQDYQPINQTYKDGRFEVTAIRCKITAALLTGNQLVSRRPEPGMHYLTIEMTFKNLGSRTELMQAGKLYVKHEGKGLYFDEEMVVLRGWGIALQKLNPLATTTTRIVFKLPIELKGPALYHPGNMKESGDAWLPICNFN